MSEIEWLNTDEAARRLGITTRTLYRFMDQGRLPAYRFGRVFRLKMADIETFIENCRIEPGTLSHLYPDSGSADDDSSTPDDDLAAGPDDSAAAEPTGSSEQKA